MLYVLPWFLMLGWVAMPMAGVVHKPVPLTLAAVVIALSVAQCALSMRTIQQSISHYLGKERMRRRQLVPSAVLMAASFIALAALAATHGLEISLVALTLVFISMPFGAPYCLLVPLRSFAAFSAGLTVTVTAAFAVAGFTDGTLIGVLVAMVAAGCFNLIVMRPSAWSLSVMWELDGAREVQARLAVAEERLRFGRDLHDVLGRNLAVIALKSELAVQLARRGRPEAVEQVVEVQRIAQESQREMRDVVRGYREADLTVELAGARSVLRAAGIDCRITGDDGTELPAAVRSALGWAVREGTTNVLRHATDARHCAIRTRIGADRVVLVMDNDGVRERTDAGGAGGASGGPGNRSGNGGVRTAGAGSGLKGLRERLLPLGGTVEPSSRPGGSYRLTVELPVHGDGNGTTYDSENSSTHDSKSSSNKNSISGASTDGNRNGGGRSGLGSSDDSGGTEAGAA
ncbi:sensor histidine kinase [Streptomyces sp. MST-110588]|nr:sensor histidine kinase [Streptomyces sp. MST-110588]